MREVWLQPNRRVLALAAIPTLLVAAIGSLCVAMCNSTVFRALGWAMAGLGAVLVVGLLNQFRRPRIAYRDGEVLFNLRAGPPVAVPVSLVEAFFVGQGPADLPHTGKGAETVNLVARLSQKAPEWAHVSVKAALGHWRESYVTIRGAWCEPLNGELIRRLNRRLREIREDSKPPSNDEGTNPDGECNE